MKRKLSAVMKPETDLAAIYDNATELEQVFIKKLALFFTGEREVALEPSQSGRSLLLGYRSIDWPRGLERASKTLGLGFLSGGSDIFRCCMIGSFLCIQLRLVFSYDAVQCRDRR